MSHLTRNDYAAALALLIDLERAAVAVPRLLDEALARLPAYVACETAELASDKACVVDGDRFAASLPLGSGRGSIVLRRRTMPFTPRDRERLALLQPHLAYLHAQASRHADAILLPAAPQPDVPAPIRTRRLTPREGDVMLWLSYGKTDADIAALLAISKRTVHKHLEHIYEKLGVETRTAAVMAVRRGDR